MGVQTTMLVRSKILRELGLDEDIHQTIYDNMIKSGLDIRVGTPFKKVTKCEDGSLDVHLENGETVNTD